MENETIAAIATSLGEAGIGIVRISGEDSVAIASRIFKQTRDQALSDTSGYRLRHGKAVDPATNQVIDEVLVAVMHKPLSYTGEDVIEFQCHGGIVVVRTLLEVILRQGARLAQAGEFTKRAFLNGRLDLSQAEAVIDVIRSKTEVSLDLAVRQLEGGLSKRIEVFSEQLYDLVVRIEASIDFPEDDIPEVELVEMEQTIADIKAQIGQLIATADDGKVFRDGIKTVITGKPNVGKSSLLNKLLNDNRALVTEIPGTTRDVIEEVLNLKGIPFRILDTAGIRQTSDQIEQLGVERARDLWEEADLILHVLDASVPLSEDDYEIFSQLQHKRRIVIINKTDLPQVWECKDLPPLGDATLLQLSLLDNGVDQVINEMVEYVNRGRVSKNQEGAIITRSRHKHALELAEDDLDQALTTVRQGLPVDLVAVGLQGALEHLGEITGETVRESIIDRIFSQFCIGK